MQSFYGGPNGQSFKAKEIFTSKNGLTNSLVSDLAKGWTSPVGIGEFVIISYGMPHDDRFDELRAIDLNKEGKSYNSTLWEKCYDETQGNANGLYYKLLASMTGNTPEIQILQPTRIIDADQEPYLEYDNSDVDYPEIQFYLPRNQVLAKVDEEVLDANEPPQVVYDDGKEDLPEEEGYIGTINFPMIRFKLPQSQVIERAEVAYLNVNEPPNVFLNIDDINRPVLEFSLPVAQQLIPDNVRDVVLDADEDPYIEFDDTDPNKPILTFYLPQSQVMQQPSTQVVDPTVKPSVEDIGTVNAPKLEFSLPRAIQFYYGTLLGKRTEGTYVLSNDAFANYAVGDYYINAISGFIYRVIAKEGNECTFQYVASIQAPLPEVVVDDEYLNPYTESLEPAAPQVSMEFKDTVEKTGWVLTFKMPQVPIPKATTEFVGVIEDGEVTAEVASETEVGLHFKIPRGSQIIADTIMFSGNEVGPGNYDTVIEGAKPGDIYVNTDPLGNGEVYILNKAGIWEKQKGSLKGPPGDALNVVREYRLHTTDTFVNNLTNGVNHIIANYIDDEGNPLEYKPDELFAITWIDEDLLETSYWYFYTEEGVWARIQLTSGVTSFIETVYNDESDGPVDDKTYSISYINQLIGGNLDLDNMDKVAFSKDQIYSLLSWGTWEDAMSGPEIPEPENEDTLSAEEVVELISWSSIASLQVKN